MSTGRGATAAALAIRALRRRNLRPGYQSALEFSFERELCAIGLEPAAVKLCWLRDIETYLIEMASDTILPILAEICRMILAPVRSVTGLGVELRLFGICWLCLIVYSQNQPEPSGYRSEKRRTMVAMAMCGPRRPSSDGF